MTTAIFHRRTVPTTGLPSYARPHLRSSLALNTRLFLDEAEPPSRLTVTADGLRTPIDPHDSLAAHADAAQQRAETAQRRARALTGIADRHAARLNRL